MTAPKLLFAGANGQSSVRAIFDQPMRAIGASSAEDPVNPANWSVGGGLPAIQSVIRTSNIEFELVLVSKAPLAGGYSINVASTVQSAGSGEAMDPGYLSATFAVTVADLVVSAVAWTTPTELSISFSEAIAQIAFDEFSDVVRLDTTEGARLPAVIGLSQSGAIFRVNLANAGTAGAKYQITLNREVFVSNAVNTTLLAGNENQSVWGQGEAPGIASLAVSEDTVTVTSSEVLGDFPTVSGWPLSHGLYSTDLGSLGPSTPLELGTSDAQLVASGANLKGKVGQTATFSLKKTARSIPVATSWAALATYVVGAGNETVGVGSTTLNKTSGAPFEVVFSGGNDSLARAGREVTATMDITFTSGPTAFPLVAFTLLNTQASVVIEKTTDDMAIVTLYRGNKTLGISSEKFDPTTPFTFRIIDATSDNKGWLAVAVDDVVILGARSSSILDSSIIQTNVGATAVAITLGSPAAPTETFSVEFTAPLVAQTYLGTGFLGLDSKDLFSFADSSDSVVVAAASVPTSGGYENTGNEAFGVHAEYLPSIDAIQVIVGLNQDAIPLQFTGSVTLLTGDEQPMDQALIDETFVLIGGEEIIVVFLKPKCWAGVLVSAALRIASVDYAVTVPVTRLGDPVVSGSLAPQPANWYHQRLSNNVDSGNLSEFGPATVIGTP